MGNFDFLENAYPKIYEACDEMEHHFSTRKFKAALKAGREAAEYIVLEIFREEGKRTFYKKDGKEIYYSQNKLIKKLHFDFNVFKNNTYRIFDEIKALGNDASHPNPRTFTENDGRNMVRNVFKASTYFYFDYLDNPDRFKPKYKEVPFFLPKEEIGKVNDKVDGLVDKISLLDEKFDGLSNISDQSEILEKIKDFGDLKEDFDILKEQIGFIEKNPELIEIKDGLSSQSNYIDGLNSRMKDLEGTLDNFDNLIRDSVDLDKLNDNIDNVNIKVANLENDVNNKVSRINTQLSDMDGRFQNLENEIMELQSKEDRTEDDDRELENLNSQLNVLASQREELYDSIKSINKDVESLKTLFSQIDTDYQDEMISVMERLNALESNPFIGSYPPGEKIINHNIKNPNIGNLILKLGHDKSGHNVEISFDNLAFNGNCKGKYGFIQNLVLQLSQYDVPTIIIDTEDNFTTKNLNEDFKDSLEGNLYKAVVKAIGFPLNPFKKYKKEIDGRFIDEDERDIAYRFVNVIGSVYDLTVNESDSIQKAVLDGLRNGDDFNFEDLEEKLLSQSSMASHSALARLMELFENNPFDSSSQYNWTYLDNLKGTVNIIQLGGFSTEIQKIILEFILWDLWYYKLSGNKDNPFAVLMDYDFIDFGLDSVASLVLSEGGSYGWSLWLDNCPCLENKVFNKIEFKPDNSALLDDHEFLFDGKY